MSASILLKQTMSRRTDAVLHLAQHCLMIVGLVFALGFVNFVIGDPVSGVFRSVLPDTGILGGVVTDQEAEDAPPGTASGSLEDGLSPRMRGALAYVAQRYKVSADAVRPVFEAAQLVGQEKRIDPLLIVAIIGIESGFNPFAESAMGAKGLMQIIPRFHMDKVPDGLDGRAFLDPVANIRIGALVLQEAIQRRGGLVAGLQYYAGSSDPEGFYANKVMAEKARLEQAAARRSAG